MLAFLVLPLHFNIYNTLAVNKKEYFICIGVITETNKEKILQGKYKFGIIRLPDVRFVKLIEIYYFLNDDFEITKNYDNGPTYIIEWSFKESTTGNTLQNKTKWKKWSIKAYIVRVDNV